MTADVARTDNSIAVTGALDDYALRGVLSQFHKMIMRGGFSDIVLSFKRCSSVDQGAMLFLCARILKHREDGIKFSLVVPDDRKLQKLFGNTGWGHVIDPQQCAPSDFHGYSHVPPTQYQTPDEQRRAVDRIIAMLLSAVPGLSRAGLAAFEWSINEIMDNVLVHSDSPIGGLVAMQTLRNAHCVNFMVADAGVGIPRTLRHGRPELRSDREALAEAIREGITRDSKVGQGNGLFGSYQICSKCKGEFHVHSGYASIVFIAKKKKPLDMKDERIPYAGTLVDVVIDFSHSKLLDEALQFRGRKHAPVDFVETEYAHTAEGGMHFALIKECASFGSRMAGKPVRTKLSNLCRMSGAGKIRIDLNGIPIVSSSFADEVFGKLFLEIGAVEFMQRFEVINAMETVRHLIDRAITQRVAAGIAD